MRILVVIMVFLGVFTTGAHASWYYATKHEVSQVRSEARHGIGQNEASISVLADTVEQDRASGQRKDAEQDGDIQWLDWRTGRVDRKAKLNRSHILRVEGSTTQALDGVIGNGQRIDATDRRAHQNSESISTLAGQVEQGFEALKTVDQKLMRAIAITRAEARAGVASAMAFSGLPRAFRGGSVIGVGIGYFQSQPAIAIGAESSFGGDSQWSVNAGVAIAGPLRSVKIGAGYHW
jgi:autotransporter adhesin